MATAHGRILVLLSLLTIGASNAFAQSSAAPSSGSLETRVTAPEGDAKRPKTKLKLKTGLRSQSKEDTYLNSKYTGATLDLVGALDFNSVLSAHLDIGGLFARGTYSNLYTDEGKAPNGIWLNEVSLTLKPVEAFALEAGVLPFKFDSVPNTSIDPYSGHPAVLGTTRVGNELVAGSIFVMQAIPTSSAGSVASNEGGITTTLLTYGTGVNLNTPGKMLALDLGYRRFRFDGLNASVAQDSRLMGNSVVSPGPQARFLYGFEGQELGGRITLSISRSTSMNVGGAVLRNDLAPDGMSLAYDYSGGIKTSLLGLDVGLSGGYFYIQPDALPAVYMSSRNVSTNRFGTTMGLNIESKKHQVSGSVQHTRANTIEDRWFMADREIITLSLKVAHDLL